MNMGSFESFRRVDVYGFAMLMWETLRRCMTHDGVEVCCTRLRTIMITPMMMTTMMMTMVMLTFLWNCGLLHGKKINDVGDDVFC